MEIPEYVSRSNKILITSHVSPDGDAIGSCLALSAALRKLGKNTTVAFADAIPTMFRFLPGWEDVRGADVELTGIDLIFVLDLSDIDRVGSIYSKLPLGSAPVINIDHHPTNTQFGSVNIVFPDAGATCELLWPIIRSLGVAIDKEIAACLLTGLITDTLGFRVSNTKASTLRLAADLVEYGVSISAITDAVFNSRPYPAVKLMGLALSQVQRRERMVWTSITKSMMLESGASPEDCEAITNLLASVRDADAAIVFKELEEGSIRVSIRTTDRLNAGQVCQHYGGGGHFRAAGCGIRASLQAAQQSFLGYVEDALSS